MVVGRCARCFSLILDDTEYGEGPEGLFHVRCGRLKTMKHILSFDDVSERLVYGCSTKAFWTRKLDRRFTVESLVVLTPAFFIVSLELEGQPTAYFGRTLVGEGAGKPLPVPAFVVEPGKQLGMMVINAKESQEFFGAYFFGTLEIE